MEGFIQNVDVNIVMKTPYFYLTIKNDIEKIDFSKYDCIRTDTRKKMWLLPMRYWMSMYKQALEFNLDGSAKISEFRNLYEHWPTSIFLNEEYVRGGSILYDNLHNKDVIIDIIKKYKLK